ncbi:MAG: 50S ribosomal protein L25 [Dehalococcoidia bacterium]
MTSDVDTYELTPRAVLGKKVKRLRREGTLPANIYGRGLESVAVQIPLRTARELLTAHGTNTLISVEVEGEKQARPVIVRDVKVHPVSGALQHLDFFQVDLTRTIRAAVPVVLIGVAPAVAEHGGIVLTGITTVQVEALPADVPDHFEISVEQLAEIDQQILVGALVVPQGVTVHSDEDQMLVRITRPRLIEEEEEEVLEGEEELAEGEEGEEAEGEAAEGEEESE